MNEKKSLYNKSKLIQERSKELSEIAKKAGQLDLELENARRNKNANGLAYKMAAEIARKQTHLDGRKFDDLSPKEQDRVLDYYVYDEGFLEKAEKQVAKNDPKVKALRQERNQAVKEYKQQCAKIAEEICGKYGNKPVPGFSDHQKLKYKELVQYALGTGNGMWMLSSNEEMGRPR